MYAKAWPEGTHGVTKAEDSYVDELLERIRAHSGATSGCLSESPHLCTSIGLRQNARVTRLVFCIDAEQGHLINQSVAPPPKSGSLSEQRGGNAKTWSDHGRTLPASKNSQIVCDHRQNYLKRRRA